MADISAEITAFKNAVYGEDVRDAMVSLANKVNTESTSAKALADDFSMIAKNLQDFNFANVWLKGLLNSAGEFVSYNNCRCSDFIPIESDMIAISHQHPIEVTFFNESKTKTFGPITYSNTNPIIINYDSSYFRIQFNIANIDPDDVYDEIKIICQSRNELFLDNVRFKQSILNSAGIDSVNQNYISTNFISTSNIDKIAINDENISVIAINYFDINKNPTIYTKVLYNKPECWVMDYPYLRISTSNTDLTVTNFFNKISFFNKKQLETNILRTGILKWYPGLFNSGIQFVANNNYRTSNYIAITSDIKMVEASIPFLIYYFDDDKTYSFYLPSTNYDNTSASSYCAIIDHKKAYFRLVTRDISSLTSISDAFVFSYYDENPKFYVSGAFIGSNGYYSRNNNYVISDYIDTHIIERIKNSVAINVNYYDEDFTHKLYTTINSGTNSINTKYTYCRLWTAGTVDDFYDAIHIYYGTPYISDIENDIAIPNNIYMLQDIEYDLFAYNYTKRKDYLFKLGCQNINSSTTPIVRQAGNVTKILKPENIPNSILTARIYSPNAFGGNNSYSSYKEIQVLLSNKNTNTGTTYATIIGDSFTAMSPSFIDYIFEENLCPGVQFVGLRRNKEYTTQYHEGRGGWGIAQYSEPAIGASNPYAGFWQPKNTNKYWGDIRFWVNAKNVTPSSEYLVGGFDTSKFNSSGYLISPTTDDIMYNGTNYVKYDGSDWVSFDISSIEWGHNYSKYLSMWNITAPSICLIMLGMNDFRSNWSQPSWTAFKNRMDSFIDSYKTAVSGGKVVIIIHCSDVGRNSEGYYDYLPPAIQNNNLWQYRKVLISEYDGRENDNIYICDAGVMVDGENGYETVEELPFSTYEGSNRILLQTRSPHPTLSYSAMSLPVAAIIQYIRAL